MKKHALLTVILSCWILLLICLVIKLFFNNFFEINIKNQKILDAGMYIDNHTWLKYLIVTIVYIPSTYLLYLSISKKKLFYDWWIIFLIIPTPSLKGLINEWLGLSIELIILIVIPLIRNKGRNWLRVIIGIALIFGYQAIILLIRNLGLYLTSENVLIGLVMNIDYYIMIVLFYLHSNYTLVNKINDAKEEE